MLLVIQGTGFCNLDCSYCYLPNRDKTASIKIDAIDKIVERIKEWPAKPSEISVVWHAGEPLVLPINFYKEVFSRFSSLTSESLRISHNIQTNATLITSKWAEFFLEHEVQIGVSIDGPEHIHNFARKHRDGRGSWDECMRGIKILQDKNVPFHVISVLSSRSLADPDALYEFYRQNEFYNIAFNFEEIDGINKNSSLDIVSAKEDAYNFLYAFLELNRQNGNSIIVREAEQAAAALIRGKFDRNTQAIAGDIISIDLDGNVSTFSPELLGIKNAEFDDFLIGNIFDQSFAAMISGANAQLMQREIDIGIEACSRSCGYFALCGGGAPANKMGETGTMRAAETIYCRVSIQAVLDACGDILTNISRSRRQ